MNLRHRGLGALLAVGYLLGYLLVFVHFAVEQHGVCVEHAGAHHVDDAGNSKAEAAEEGLAALPGAVDDHCHLLNAVRVSVTHESRAVVTALAPLDLPDVSLGSAPSAPPIHGAVWRYAPKQSPPSHA